MFFARLVLARFSPQSGGSRAHRALLWPGGAAAGLGRQESSTAAARGFRTQVTGHGEGLAALLCSPERWHGRSLPSCSALLSFLEQRETRQPDTRALIPNQVESRNVNCTSDGLPRPKEKDLTPDLHGSCPNAWTTFPFWIPAS